MTNEPDHITLPTIHEAVSRKVELAGVYMEDGAFHSAARHLREASEMCLIHAARVDVELELADWQS